MSEAGYNWAHVKAYERNGQDYVYFRPTKKRLPAPVGSQEFINAYAKAYSDWVSTTDIKPVGETRKQRRRDMIADRKQRLESEDALKYAIYRSRARAKKINREFSLTYEWAVERLKEQDHKCAMTGLPFSDEKGTSSASPYVISFDRIDCAKGYTQDNVRIVIFAVNAMMRDWGEDVMAKVAQAYLDQKAKTQP